MMKTLNQLLLIVFIGSALSENSEGCVAAISDNSCSLCFGTLDDSNVCKVFNKDTDTCTLSMFRADINNRFCVFCLGDKIPTAPGTIGCTDIVNDANKVANCNSHSGENKCGFCESEHILSKDTSTCTPITASTRIEHCWEYQEHDTDGSIICTSCGSGYKPSDDGKTCVTGIDNCLTTPDVAMGGSCAECKVKTGWYASVPDSNDSKISVCKATVTLNIPEQFGFVVSIAPVAVTSTETSSKMILGEVFLCTSLAAIIMSI